MQLNTTSIHNNENLNPCRLRLSCAEQSHLVLSKADRVALVDKINRISKLTGSKEHQSTFRSLIGQKQTERQLHQMEKMYMKDVLEILEVIPRLIIPHEVLDAFHRQIWSVFLPSSNENIRKITFQLLKLVIKYQYDRLGDLTYAIFQLLVQHVENLKADYEQCQESIRLLTMDGRRMHSFLTGKTWHSLLMALLENSSEHEKIVQFLSHLIRRNNHSVSCETVQKFMSILCDRYDYAWKNGQNLYASRYLKFFLALANAGYDHIVCSEDCLLTLCCMVNGDGHNTWAIMKRLLNGALSHQVLLGLLYLLDNPRKYSQWVLRGAVFFIGMSCWGSQRVINLEFGWGTILPSFLTALDCHEEVVVFEVVLSIQRLIKKYGHSMLVEWDIILEIFAVLHSWIIQNDHSNSHHDSNHNANEMEVANSTVSAVCESSSSYDVGVSYDIVSKPSSNDIKSRLSHLDRESVQSIQNSNSVPVSRITEEILDTLLLIEDIYRRGIYLGDSTHFFSVLFLYVPYLNEKSTSLIIKEKAKLTHPANSAHWLESLKEIIDLFYCQKSPEGMYTGGKCIQSEKIRQEVIDVLQMTLWSCRSVYEDKVIDEIVLVYFSTVYNDDHPSIRRKGLDLIMEVARQLDSSKFENLLDILENAIKLSNFADSQKIATSGVVSLFSSSFNHLPSSRSVRMYKLVTSFLETHRNVQVREICLACLLHISEADEDFQLIWSDNQIRTSPFLTCAKSQNAIGKYKKLHMGTQFSIGSDGVISCVPVHLSLNALLSLISAETNCVVFRMAVKAIHKMFANRFILHSIDLSSVASKLLSCLECRAFGRASIADELVTLSASYDTSTEVSKSSMKLRQRCFTESDISSYLKPPTSTFEQTHDFNDTHPTHRLDPKDLNMQNATQKYLVTEESNYISRQGNYFLDNAFIKISYLNMGFELLLLLTSYFTESSTPNMEKSERFRRQKELLVCFLNVLGIQPMVAYDLLFENSASTEKKNSRRHPYSDSKCKEVIIEEDNIGSSNMKNKVKRRTKSTGIPQPNNSVGALVAVNTDFNIPAATSAHVSNHVPIESAEETQINCLSGYDTFENSASSKNSSYSSGTSLGSSISSSSLDITSSNSDSIIDDDGGLNNSKPARQAKKRNMKKDSSPKGFTSRVLSRFHSRKSSEIEESYDTPKEVQEKCARERKVFEVEMKLKQNSFGGISLICMIAPQVVSSDLIDLLLINITKSYTGVNGKHRLDIYCLSLETLHTLLSIEKGRAIGFNIVHLKKIVKLLLVGFRHSKLLQANKHTRFLSFQLLLQCISACPLSSRKALANLVMPIFREYILEGKCCADRNSIFFSTPRNHSMRRISSGCTCIISCAVDFILRFVYGTVDGNAQLCSLGSSQVVSPFKETKISSKTRTWVFQNLLYTITTYKNGAADVIIRRATSKSHWILQSQNLQWDSIKHKLHSSIQAVPSVSSNNEIGKKNTSHERDLGQIYRVKSDSAISSSQEREGKNILSKSKDDSDVHLRYESSRSNENKFLHNSASNFENEVYIQDPSFYMMQLHSAVNDEMPQLVKNSDSLDRALKILDLTPCLETFKIGILYVDKGQKLEKDILANAYGSPNYIDFLRGMGDIVELNTLSTYAGGLDVKNNEDGKYAIAWEDECAQVIFHVATMMCAIENESVSSESQSPRKKRHIGNDFVHIVYIENGFTYDTSIISGQFNDVHILIFPLKNSEYRIEVKVKTGIPSFGPLYGTQIIPKKDLCLAIRLTSLNAHIACRFFHEEHVEFITNAQERLRQIQQIKARQTTTDHWPWS